MFVNERINQLINEIPVISYKQHLTNKEMALSAEMASALGNANYKRKMIRVLATVIDAITAKMEIKEVVSNDTIVTQSIAQWLTLNKWDTLEKDIYKAVVRDGKTFALAAYNNNPAIYQIDSYDGKTGCYIEYDDTNIAKYAVNTWRKKNVSYLDIYYPDSIERYITNKDGEWIPLTTIDWTDTNNQAIGIPVIEFNIGESDLANGAIQLQIDINEALVDLIAVSRTQGWPQKYVKNAKAGQYLSNMYGQPWLNSSGYPTPRTEKLIPGSTKLLSENEELGQLPTATADKTVFDALLHALYISTTVPTFYFNSEWPSGVALINAESKLNHKVENHEARLSPAIDTLIRTMLKLSNIFSNTAYNIDSNIDITWYPPQTETADLLMQQQQSLAQVITLLKGAGVISIEQAVRMLHTTWNDTEIATEVARIQTENSIPSL